MFDSTKLTQALVRGGRTLLAAAIAAMLTAAPQVVLDAHLQPEFNVVAIFLLTSAFNAAGKFIRGETIQVDPSKASRLPI